MSVPMWLTLFETVQICVRAAAGASLDLRHRVFRPFKKALHFLHINLGGGIVLMAHHLLDLH